MAASPIVRLTAMAQRVPRWRWWLVVGMFIVGILLRWPMTEGSHREGDEAVYTSLVFELQQGHGYSLQKSPLVTRGVLDRFQYDRPLFHHPPGGIALFWLTHQIFGKDGFAAAQVLSFAVFFWAMLWLARSLAITRSDLGLLLVALLAACNPILAHVTTKYWLDGPLLAFATLGAALFLRSLVVSQDRPAPEKVRAKSLQSETTPGRGQRDLLLAVLAGVVIGYASLIKLTAFTMIPGVLLLAWAMHPQPKRVVVHGAAFVVAALVVQAPWEIWQWLVVDSPFPQWAGRPSASLVASNGFVRFVTIERSPWIYITKTPVVLTTIIPSVALLTLSYAQARDAAPSVDTLQTRRAAMACFLWLVIVIAFSTALGLVGYSRLLRYAILMVPAAILMPALLVSQPESAFTGIVRTLRRPLFAFLAAGVFLEVALGIQAAFRIPHALIVPLTGL